MHDSCLNLLKTIGENVSRYVEKNLVDLDRYRLRELIDAFNNVDKSFREFEEKCSSVLERSLYEYWASILEITRLKLCVAIENKVRSSSISNEKVERAEAERIINTYKESEKRLIREIDKLDTLDSSDDIKRYIISKPGGIHELIKEAVSREQAHFEQLVESWLSKCDVGKYVRKGLIKIYNRRLSNVVKALQKLISEDPTWILKLFREYEDALLSSSRLRRAFEESVKEVFEKKAKNLGEQVERLENEKKVLMEKIDELSNKVYLAEAEKKVVVEQLAKLQQELNKLRNSHNEVLEKYNKVLGEWEASLKELESYKKKLLEKEKELEEIKKRKKEDEVAKEVLELEILRLRQLVASYESKLREYEAEKRKLDLELRSAGERLSEMEKVIRGKVEGRAIHIEEVNILHTIFINKLQDKLRTQPVILRTPWGTEAIDKWSDVKIYYEGDPDLPRAVRAVFTYEKRPLLGLGEKRRITVIGISLLSDREAKKRGFALTRASLSDLNEVLREASGGVREGRALNLIAISSPTGWDEGALKYVTGEGGPSLITTELVVLLVDPVENKVYYPEQLAKTARYIEDYARLFVLETSVEEENRIASTIRNLCDEAKAGSPFEPAFPYRLIGERVKLTSWLSLVRVIHTLKERDLIELKRDGEKLFVRCKGTW